MAAKKVSKSGASDRAKKAQASRMNAQAARERSMKARGNRAATERMSEQAYRSRSEVGYDSDGFYSTALYNKRQLGLARWNAQGAKTASQQMRQGVTRSGGYAGSGVNEANSLAELRKVRSAKFKAEQAIKKSPMTRKPANKKKGAR